MREAPIYSPLSLRGTDVPLGEGHSKKSAVVGRVTAASNLTHENCFLG